MPSWRYQSHRSSASSFLSRRGVLILAGDSCRLQRLHWDPLQAEQMGLFGALSRNFLLGEMTGLSQMQQVLACYEIIHVDRSDRRWPRAARVLSPPSPVAFTSKRMYVIEPKVYSLFCSIGYLHGTNSRYQARDGLQRCRDSMKEGRRGFV
jgi:hypothetical protein